MTVAAAPLDPTRVVVAHPPPSGGTSESCDEKTATCVAANFAYCYYTALTTGGTVYRELMPTAETAWPRDIDRIHVHQLDAQPSATGICVTVEGSLTTQHCDASALSPTGTCDFVHTVQLRASPAHPMRFDLWSESVLCTCAKVSEQAAHDVTSEEKAKEPPPQQPPSSKSDFVSATPTETTMMGEAAAANESDVVAQNEVEPGTAEKDKEKEEEAIASSSPAAAVCDANGTATQSQNTSPRGKVVCSYVDCIRRGSASVRALGETGKRSGAPAVVVEARASTRTTASASSAVKKQTRSSSLSGEAVSTTGSRVKRPTDTHASAAVTKTKSTTLKVHHAAHTREGCVTKAPRAVTTVTTGVKTSSLAGAKTVAKSTRTHTAKSATANTVTATKATTAAATSPTKVRSPPAAPAADADAATEGTASTKTSKVRTTTTTTAAAATTTKKRTSTPTRRLVVYKSMPPKSVVDKHMATSHTPLQPTAGPMKKATPAHTTPTSGSVAKTRVAPKTTTGSSASTPAAATASSSLLTKMSTMGAVRAVGRSTPRKTATHAAVVATKPAAAVATVGGEKSSVHRTKASLPAKSTTSALNASE